MTTLTPLEALTLHGIKPSVQRLAVMEYLLRHRTHPCAEEIYMALSKKMPTLSRTTVYNSLRVLTEQGAAIPINIDEKNACFDADTSPHAHFLCRQCGRVYDIPLSCQRLEASAAWPEGFKADFSALYFKGLCPACSPDVALPADEQ